MKTGLAKKVVGLSLAVGLVSSGGLVGSAKSTLISSPSKAVSTSTVKKAVPSKSTVAKTVVENTEYTVPTIKFSTDSKGTWATDVQKKVVIKTSGLSKKAKSKMDKTIKEEMKKMNQNAINYKITNGFGKDTKRSEPVVSGMQVGNYVNIVVTWGTDLKGRSYMYKESLLFKKDGTQVKNSKYSSVVKGKALKEVQEGMYDAVSKVESSYTAGINYYKLSTGIIDGSGIQSMELDRNGNLKLYMKVTSMNGNVMGYSPYKVQKSKLK